MTNASFIPYPTQKPKRWKRHKIYSELPMAPSLAVIPETFADIIHPVQPSYQLFEDREERDALLRVLVSLDRKLSKTHEDWTALISDTQSSLFIDYRGYKHLYVFSANAITLNLHDIGTLAVAANTWTNISFRETMQVFTSGQAVAVPVYLRATNEVIASSRATVTNFPSNLALESGGNLALAKADLDILAGGISNNLYQENLVQIGGRAAQMGGVHAAPSNMLQILPGMLDGSGTTHSIESAGSAGSVGTSANETLAMIPYKWNDSASSPEIERNNQPAVNAISATNVITTQTSADLSNFNSRGIIVFLNITAITAGSVGVVVNNKDDQTGNYLTVLTGTTQSGIGETMYIIYPGETVSAGLDLSQLLSRTFQLKAVVVTGPATFTLNYCLLV